jgi:hypothetical protein
LGSHHQANTVHGGELPDANEQVHEVLARVVLEAHNPVDDRDEDNGRNHAERPLTAQERRELLGSTTEVGREVHVSDSDSSPDFRSPAHARLGFKETRTMSC